MRDFVSFHPVDVAFFDELIAPLTAGARSIPKRSSRSAGSVRRAAGSGAGTRSRSRGSAVLIEAPKADPKSSMWQRLRTNLEKIDHKPDEVVRRAAKVVRPPTSTWTAGRSS
jgi:hypothetical protein